MSCLVWPLTETKCGASWMETLVWCSTAGLMFLRFLMAHSSYVEVALHHLQSLVHYPFFETTSAKVLTKWLSKRLIKKISCLQKAVSLLPQEVFVLVLSKAWDFLFPETAWC